MNIRAMTASRGSATKAIAGPTPAASPAARIAAAKAGSTAWRGDYGRSQRPRLGRRTAARLHRHGIDRRRIHDPHYSEWRRRQLDELDRDYDDYRRENQSGSRAISSSGATRAAGQAPAARPGPRAYDCRRIGRGAYRHRRPVRGDRIILTKGDSEDGQHHSLNCSLVDRVEGDRVILDQPAAEAKQQLSTEDRDRGLFERDEDREPGPHMLNRSFSGTYER